MHSSFAGFQITVIQGFHMRNLSYVFFLSGSGLKITKTIRRNVSYDKAPSAGKGFEDRIERGIHSLELCGTRSSGERNDIPDVLHSRHKQNQALESQSESCVRT